MPRSYSILVGQAIKCSEDVEGRSAEQHLKNDDFFHIVDGDGEVTFVLGGKAAGPVREGSNPSDPTLLSSGIVGGETRVLKKGDGVHIPAGVWHQWGARSPVVMTVFKIPAAEGKVEFKSQEGKR